MIYFTINLLILAAGYIVFSKINIRNKILGWKSNGTLRPGSKTISVMCAAAFGTGSWVLYGLLRAVIPALALGMLPAIGIYAVIDMTGRFREDKEMKQITFFLMTMTKWSGVKNDLVYCLKKTDEIGMKNPMGKMVKTTLARIYGGMDSVSALRLLEKESYGEDLRYLIRNIKFSAEKGGNLQSLFKGMEEQYFKIDEEFYKRKISTIRDRTAVYGTIVMVITAGLWFIGGNPVARQFYLGTPQGSLLLGLFVLAFAAAVLLILKR